MGKPRNCNCCDFNLPSGFVCIYCDDSGDPVCTESLTSVQCSGVSGIHMPGTCSDFPGGFCGKCDDDFESSSCESFFLSKNGPVKGDSNVFASGSYSPEKPVDLERIPTFTSHFKRGHHLRDYKGTGTYGWLSGIAPVGPTSTAGSNARLEFVNNQFPYIQGDTPTDIDYIGLCDKRRAAKYGCATIKFKNTVVGSTTTKVDKFHLKIGTFQRYGDTAILTSVVMANDQIVPAKYVGPFTSASEHNDKFLSVCKDPADSTARGGNGTVLEGIAHLLARLNDGSAHCYGGLQMACCSKLTKSMSAEYEFDVSSFPIDTCFTLYNFAKVGTSSSSYGYFELTGESPNFFETSTPTFDQNFPDCTAGFFSDNFPGCRFDTPGFNCDPPPPPPPPTTPPPPPPPPPPCGGGQFHCRYEYNYKGNPAHLSWSQEYSVGNCVSPQCGCPNRQTVMNEWRAINGSDPIEGSCIDFYVPCCRPCFDYNIIANEVCGTTTTTTEGPTTTTSTTDPPEEPFFVVVCFDPQPCVNCPEKTQQTKRCVNFPNKDQADAYSRDLLNMGLVPIQGPGACADVTNFQCSSCDSPGPCNTTTTTSAPTTTTTSAPTTTTTSAPTTTTTEVPEVIICCCYSDSSPFELVSCTETDAAGCDANNATPGQRCKRSLKGSSKPGGIGDIWNSCLDCAESDPPTTTTTTTSGPTLGCCRTCDDCCGAGTFTQDVLEEDCDGDWSSDCFISAFLAPCCATSHCPDTNCSDCFGPPDPENEDTDNPNVPDDDPTGGGSDNPTPA